MIRLVLLEMIRVNGHLLHSKSLPERSCSSLSSLLFESLIVSQLINKTTKEEEEKKLLRLQN